MSFLFLTRSITGTLAVDRLSRHSFQSLSFSCAPGIRLDWPRVSDWGRGRGREVTERLLLSGLLSTVDEDNGMHFAKRQAATAPHSLLRPNGVASALSSFQVVLPISLVNLGANR
ncbi:hypothetical protein GGR58DRAFT_482019 [Xylaria digitata]|nr:hypothetical protein GGR58DRAFT_482019 [Xylaria digitata]